MEACAASVVVVAAGVSSRRPEMAGEEAVSRRGASDGDRRGMRLQKEDYKTRKYKKYRLAKESRSMQ